MNVNDDTRAVCPYYGRTSRQRKTRNSKIHWIVCNGIYGENTETTIHFDDAQELAERVEKYCFKEFWKCPIFGHTELKEKQENFYPCLGCKSEKRCSNYAECKPYKIWLKREWSFIKQRLKK